ncbi:Chromatin remodeling protein EBS [Lasiodiplodia hormozganensis]|uniref:Chromatin remodeling protein EBS n=1 Tax=Lasiodiplodia hormozganensis TaxID=869390 RepID=A0AA40CZ55_9PEZI|nr:Chromatin remodeling protein EBS [Lasiodiplodia hormozganensis]
MADPIARSRSSRAVSSTSSRRDANDRPSPIGAAKDKKDPPALDWSKFNFNFTVKHHPFPKDTARPAKKRKRSFARKPELEENAFDKSLRTLYTVEPAKWWNGTKRYRKFTIATETFRTGEIVYVKPDEYEAPDGPLESWVAKVLEVRAASEQHVFLRVFWMYRPEDLPGGRRPYHGENEVIASNRMQIIDALTVNGKADLKHWTEEDGDDVPDADQLFWRQTFDWANGTGTGVLSSLRKHCIDEAPFNPDSLLVHCDTCGLWLHSECLEIEAVKQAHAKKGLPEPNLLPTYQQSAHFTQAAENGDGSTHPKVDAQAKTELVEPAFLAEVKTDLDGKSYVLLKGTGEGQEGEELKEEIRCLKCNALIE